MIIADMLDFKYILVSSASIKFMSKTGLSVIYYLKGNGVVVYNEQDFPIKKASIEL